MLKKYSLLRLLLLKRRKNLVGAQNLTQILILMKLVALSTPLMLIFDCVVFNSSPLSVQPEKPTVPAKRPLATNKKNEQVCSFVKSYFLDSYSL